MKQECTESSNGAPKRNQHGGDRVSSRAKTDSAKLEEQVRALRSRKYTFSSIGKALGIRPSTVQKIYTRIVRRQGDTDMKSFHRTEIAELELEQAEVWKILDPAQKANDYRIVCSCLSQLNRIHIRRAKLLGLDTAHKFDALAVYKMDDPKIGAKRRTRQRLLEDMAPEDQVALFEIYERAAKRAADRAGGTKTPHR